VFREVEPPLEPKDPDDLAACHFPLADDELERLAGGRGRQAAA
jgi:hypothetical protein